MRLLSPTYLVAKLERRDNSLFGFCFKSSLLMSSKSSRIRAAVGLSFASVCQHLTISFLSSSGDSYSFRTDEDLWCSEGRLPLKLDSTALKEDVFRTASVYGFSCVSSSLSVMPKANISALSSYRSSFRISGARYWKLIIRVVESKQRSKAMLKNIAKASLLIIDENIMRSNIKMRILE